MKDLKMQALEFNETHVRGQKVKINLNGKVIETTLSTNAFPLESDVCVCVEGVDGYIPIFTIIE